MSELQNVPSPVELLDKGEWHARLDEQVLAAAEAGSPLSVLFVDVNRFKDINDELGHDVGDEVIEAIGDVVGQLDGDFLVGGHIGGDEFAISGETDEAGAKIIEEQVHQAFSGFLNQPKNEKLKALDISLAIGLATYRAGMTSSELMRIADDAMYANKLDQLPELTSAQKEALYAARVVLESEGLRLRDLSKYEQLIRVIDKATDKAS